MKSIDFNDINKEHAEMIYRFLLRMCNDEHLEQCPECSKRLEEYKKELEDNKTENTVKNDGAGREDLKPMKKVKKKLVMGKVKIAILGVILAVIVGGLGFLSFGQITNECMSFSVLADTARIYSVCKTLADGDTEPFMDIIAYRIADQYTVNGSQELENFDAYMAKVEADVKNACEYYFAGKNVRVKIQGIDQYPYAEEEPTDSSNTDITIGFYEKNELLYELAFGKVSEGKFIIYELPQEGAPAFTKSMLPFYDTSLDICLHYATKKAYNDLLEKKIEKAGAGLALAVTTWGTDEEKSVYRDVIIERIQKLCDEGWYYKDVMYFVDEYDITAGKWIYKVWFMLENQSNGEIVMIEQKFHYFRQQLYVIEDSPAVVIGGEGELTPEIKTRLQEIFQ